MKIFNSNKPRNFDKGFTLVELLIIVGIAVFMTYSLLSSSIFRTRINFEETARTVIADIRLAQANALASKQFKNPSTGVLEHRCGYGVYRKDSRSYYIYAGRVPPSCDPHQYGNNADEVIITRVLDSRLEILDPQGAFACAEAGMAGGCPRFRDIFFKAPYGTIYIRNQGPGHVNNPSNNLSSIVIRKIGSICPSNDCLYICVYSFGSIERRTEPCQSLAGP